MLTFKSFMVTNYTGRDLFLRKLTNIFLFYFANSNINSVSPVLAGHTITGKDFREKYLSKLFDTPQIVGLFLQNKVNSDTDHHRISFTRTQCSTLTGLLICPLGNQFMFLVAHYVNIPCPLELRRVLQIKCSFYFIFKKNDDLY